MLSLAWKFSATFSSSLHHSRHACVYRHLFLCFYIIIPLILFSVFEEHDWMQNKDIRIIGCRVLQAHAPKS